MTFQINQIFEKTYPLEAAVWCNENNAFIEELDSVGDIRQFQIKEIVVHEPTAEEIQDLLTAKVQAYLDATAQKLGYDSCLSVCSYVDTGVAKFDEDGDAFRKWRSAVWAKGYEIVAEVQAGTREIPTEEELFAELPAIELDREELKA